MVGANIRFLRIARRLTQTKVSLAIDVTFQQMQKYEAGTNCLNTYRLVQLADFFKVGVQDLVNPDFIANNCKKKLSLTPQDAGYLKPQKGIGSFEEIDDKTMDAALKKAEAEGRLEPKVVVGSLDEIKDKLKKDGIDPEDTILPTLRKAASPGISNEQIKMVDKEHARKADTHFDSSIYEEFEDEYPAPLSQLEHDPKMRATYDAIINGRKRRH